MKRKYIICLVLCLVLALAGCGQKAESQSPAAPTQTPAYTPTPTPYPDTPYGRLLEHKAVNNDVVAWLTVPGTEIDDVVTQTTDNAYYLQRDWKKEQARWGCYFMDYINSAKGRDQLNANTIIYGHSYNSEDPDNPQFNQLFKYCDQEFVEENNTIRLQLGEEMLTFQIAAVFYTDIGFDYINPEPEAAGIDFYNTVAAKNEYVFEGIELTPEDRILTLSTCSYKYDVNDTRNHRFVVMAELLPQGSSPVPVTVTRNPDPQRPVA